MQRNTTDIMSSTKYLHFVSWIFSEYVKRYVTEPFFFLNLGNEATVNTETDFPVNKIFYIVICS